MLCAEQVLRASWHHEIPLELTGSRVSATAGACEAVVTDAALTAHLPAPPVKCQPHPLAEDWSEGSGCGSAPVLGTASNYMNTFGRWLPWATHCPPKPGLSI